MVVDDRWFDYIKDEGIRFRGKRSAVFRLLSISKPGVVWSDKELFGLSKAVVHFQESIDGLAEAPFDPDHVLQRRSFPDFTEKFAYKFTTEDTYANFVSKGSFLASSLLRYRDLEREGSAAGDRFEGASMCTFSVADRRITVSAVSGFDTNIISLTKDLSSAALLRDRFGPVVLKVEVAPFARAVARLLDVRLPIVKAVRYADLKIFRDRLPLHSLRHFPRLNQRVGIALRDGAWLPSVFAKPKRFAAENEVRLAFQSVADVAYMTPVESQNLLQYVDRID